ncbi:MAG: hypothetical protein SCARUB_04839 [Candidatus Scalindua rubra]|uniref:Uncharacterized protein n=1 Tax=Candidatus Scalindua rubra TaxID=1872076 RepID=A0A1E3X316_9BACT|nr:MAG: hypothetical protein SCARUB_04839 [Candidatus Scalindua rubra]
MNRGIFRHGKFKAFLTRGIFKYFFRPVFYKHEDFIHSNFNSILNDFAYKSKYKIKKEFYDIINFWLVLTPEYYFSKIFLKDEKNNCYLNILNNVDNQNGIECAYITQAFVLWHLKQFLSNDTIFKETIGLSFSDFEESINLVFGKENRTLYYLNYYKEKFDLSKLEVDPRDWPIIYVWDICDILFDDTEKMKDMMISWDDDLVVKMNLVRFNTEFFKHHKDWSLEIVND